MLRTFFNSAKRRFPRFFRWVFQWRDAALNTPGRWQLSRLQKDRVHLSVAYLSARFPKPPVRRSEFAHGGAVKLTYLAETFPHHFPSANLLYAVSSVAHPLQIEILQIARRRGLQIIVNQNGVGFPAWAGANYQKTNQSLKETLECADYIIYQSKFCEEGALRYLSPSNAPHEVIYNPVDTKLFRTGKYSKKPDELTLLLGGNQYAHYRLELALKVLKSVHLQNPKAKLIVTGKLRKSYDESSEWIHKALIEMDLVDHVTFTGPYAQRDAPLIFSKAHILLHTQYADASPGLVVEAMACGLPVVYIKNGGVPELVGDTGVGVQVNHDWNRINLPDSQAMADAVMQVYSCHGEYSQKARQRAVEMFSLEKFVARHKEIFEKVSGDSHL